MKLLLPEIFELINQENSRTKKKELLLKHDSKELRAVLKGAFDSSIEWDVGEFKPEYYHSVKPLSLTDMLLHQHIKMFKYLLKGSNLKKEKKVQILLGILETIHPSEAEIVLNMIFLRDILCKGLTKKLAAETFPGLIVETDAISG